MAAGMPYNILFQVLGAVEISSIFPPRINFLFADFQINNTNTRTRCEICSKLTISTPEQRQNHQSH